MDLEKIKRNKPLSVVLTMRISRDDSNFLREKNISPQGLFRESINDLRHKVRQHYRDHEEREDDRKI